MYRDVNGKVSATRKDIFKKTYRLGTNFGHLSQHYCQCTAIQPNFPGKILPSIQYATWDSTALQNMLIPKIIHGSRAVSR